MIEDTKDILMALGRLEGKMESLLHMQRNHDEELGRLDKRLRVVEQGKSALFGGAAAIGAIAAAFVSWVLRSV
jgi:hypothetical protein